MASFYRKYPFLAPKRPDDRPGGSCYAEPMPFPAQRLIQTLLNDGALPTFSASKAEWELDGLWEALKEATVEEEAHCVDFINRYRHPQTGASLASFVTHFVGHGWTAKEDLMTGHFMPLLAQEGVDVFACDKRGRNPALHALMRQDNLLAVSAVEHAFECGLSPFAVDKFTQLSLFSGSFLRERAAIFSLLQEQADATLAVMPADRQAAALEAIRTFPVHAGHERWLAEKRAYRLDQGLPTVTVRAPKPRF